jgi:hypothetical protein
MTIRTRIGGALTALAVVIGGLAAIAPPALAAPVGFTAGDLVVYRVGAGVFPYRIR